jgi:hypothetical protein
MPLLAATTTLVAPDMVLLVPGMGALELVPMGPGMMALGPVPKVLGMEPTVLLELVMEETVMAPPELVGMEPGNKLVGMVPDNKLVGMELELMTQLVPMGPATLLDLQG